MFEMMEEVDFEDEILLIHPEEDTRKLEAFENDINSNIDLELDSDNVKIEAFEVDKNSNLEQASDSDTRKIEIDNTNSNSEHASDSDNKKIETIDIDNSNSNSEHSSDSDVRKIETIEIDNADSNLQQKSDSESRKIEIIDLDEEKASDSDSGEIDDEEEANDLEEGEIQDASPISKKRSDIACRFFKRGSCVYGSQCQYLHVSDSVYKMFDTNSQKKNSIPILEHNFTKPPIFPPIILPPRSFIEPPIIVAPQIDFHRQSDAFEDTWEKGLEQAKILIRQANLKKKNGECEQRKPDSKNNNDDKVKEQYSTKAGLGNELDIGSKKLFDKNSANGSFRKENSFDDKRSNSRYQRRSSDKWVDPWRRSRSPSRKRPRSLSGSPPSRSRKLSSTSSTSSVSSSSEIDNIYRRPYKKSPRGQERRKSRSRSVSQYRGPKRQRISPKQPWDGRRNMRSDSNNAFSYRKETFSSRARSRSSSYSSSCSDCRKSPDAEEKAMKNISAKLSEQISRKSPTPKRASESLDSDCETSEMTVSSASCTSLSSDSEAESLHHYSFSKRKKSPDRYNASSYSNKTTNISNSKGFNRNYSNSLKNHDFLPRKKDIEPAYQRKMEPSNNLNNRSYKSETADFKPKNTSSYFSSVKKPASAPKLSGNKMSNDMELLSAYQGGNIQPSVNSKGQNNRSLQTESTDIKPKKTSDFSSVKKPAAAPKVSENKIPSDMELLSAYQGTVQLSDSGKKLNNKPSNGKPKNPTSNSSSVKKPATAPKVSESKLSGDMELLFMYQGMGGSNNNNSSNEQKAKSNNSTSKQAVNEANGNAQPSGDVPKDDNASKKNIVLNLQPKCNDYFKPELFNKPKDLKELLTIKKETASKREQLLTKLKLIDDAIARKKSK